MSYSEDVLKQVKEAVAAVMREDLSSCAPDQELYLDSIRRISLITELENRFDMELSLENIKPEMFSSLAAISSLVAEPR